jgi:hypothetical protein
MAPAALRATPLPAGELEKRCWLSHTRERTRVDLREPRDVNFSNLRHGQRVASPVLVQFAVRGMGVAPAGVIRPDTGHHHLLVNKALPLDVTFTLREGADLTFVTWGGCVPDVLAAAETLAGEGVQAEVLDVATLRPLDFETIRASVERTGRCVIVHEAPLTGGFGAEIAARLASEALTALFAPVQRVAGYDTVMPLPRLEHHYLPDAARILAGARRVLEYA